MAIVIGFDIHREQVTFDALDDVTGEVQRGRITPADRLALRRFWPRCRRARSMSRWKRRRVGGSSSRSCTQPVRPRIWPRRRKRQTCVGARLARKPIARTLLTREGRAALAKLELSASAPETLEVALAMIDACDAQLAPLDRELRRYARHQAGCRALMGMFGVGALTRVPQLMGTRLG